MPNATHLNEQPVYRMDTNGRFKKDKPFGIRLYSDSLNTNATTERQKIADWFQYTLQGSHPVDSIAGHRWFTQSWVMRILIFARIFDPSRMHIRANMYHTAYTSYLYPYFGDEHACFTMILKHSYSYKSICQSYDYMHIPMYIDM